VEALVALTITGALVIMVGTTFLAQNEFYSWIALRAEVQENARVTTDLITAEIRSVPLGGVVLADSQRVVFRSPMVSASVCGVTGTDGYVYVPGGSSAIDQTDLASLGQLNTSTGTWTFYDTSWSTINATGGTPAATCYANGADTASASASFLRLKLGTVTGGTPAVGDVLMLGRKTEFRIMSSALDSTYTGLFRGNYGGTLSEFATGLSSNAHFEYRYGTTTYYKVATGGNLALVDGIRIVAESTGRGTSGAKSQYAFGWTVDVPLVNTR
jgi:hypothetical protein